MRSKTSDRKTSFEEKNREFCYVVTSVKQKKERVEEDIPN